MIQETNFEVQYAQAFNDILNNGVRTENRTGIDTIAIQHAYFNIKDVQNHFPIIRGKKVYPKMALKELIWMLQGRTDVKWLNEHGVTYWDEWQNERGTIGKSYGYQYRFQNGYDQLSLLVDTMANNPSSRRHIISLWNASDIDDMELPPCMYNFHFSCVPIGHNEFRVDMHSLARSNDSFLGVPYDFMFCGWFINLIVVYLNNFSGSKYHYTVGDIHYTANDYHMYVNHKEAVIKYLNNVSEDKNNVVTDNESECIIDMKMFAGVAIRNIDNFLSIIEKNISTKNLRIVQHNDTNGFEYGTIKADIAV